MFSCGENGRRCVHVKGTLHSSELVVAVPLLAIGWHTADCRPLDRLRNLAREAYVCVCAWLPVCRPSQPEIVYEPQIAKHERAMMMQLSWCLQSFALIDPYVEYCTKDFEITPKPHCRSSHVVCPCARGKKFFLSIPIGQFYATYFRFERVPEFMLSYEQRRRRQFFLSCSSCFAFLHFLE